MPSPILLGAGLIAGIAAAFLLAYCWKGGFGLHHASRKNQAKINDNIAELALLETRQLQNMGSAEQLEHADELKSRNGIMVDDLAAEQQKILNMDISGIGKSDLLKRFKGAVIVGDSIAEASMTYQYMDDSVIIAEIGCGLDGMDRYMPIIQGKMPKVIFLTMGLNDIENYQENVDAFISAYTSRIREIMEIAPDAVIYVQSVLPVDERCQEPGHENQPLYNERLPKMCEELGIYYYDACFLLDQRPDLFDADGEHPVANFYPMWFTYMADIAGL